MALDVAFQSNINAIMARLRGNNSNAARQASEQAVEAVQWQILYGYQDVHGLPDNPHTEIVDTGRLFDSIQGEVKRTGQNTIGIAVGTNVPYACYVHDGTYKLAGRPFLYDAIRLNRTQLLSTITNNWKSGF